MEELQVLWMVLIGEHWTILEMKKSSLIKIKAFVIDTENNLWLPRRYVRKIFFYLRTYKLSLNRVFKGIGKKIWIFLLFFVFV